MDLKFTEEMLENIKKIVMYVDGACHAVAHDHPSVSSTFSNIARTLDTVVNDVNMLNGIVKIVDPQQPQQ